MSIKETGPRPITPNAPPTETAPTPESQSAKPASTVSAPSPALPPPTATPSNPLAATEALKPNQGQRPYGPKQATRDAQALRDAADAGVEVMAYRAQITPTEVELVERIPVEL